MGNPFMARQSYLPSEIRWGYQFVRCIHRPHGIATRYTVDIAKCAAGRWNKRRTAATCSQFAIGVSCHLCCCRGDTVPLRRRHNFCVKDRHTMLLCIFRVRLFSSAKFGWERPGAGFMRWSRRRISSRCRRRSCRRWWSRVPSGRCRIPSSARTRWCVGQGPCRVASTGILPGKCLSTYARASRQANSCLQLMARQTMRAKHRSTSKRQAMIHEYGHVCCVHAPPQGDSCCAQVLSDSMVLTEDDGGLCLMIRVGDTFPNQTLEPVVRAYLYRWPGSPQNPGPDYTVRRRGSMLEACSCRLQRLCRPLGGGDTAVCRAVATASLA